MERDVANFNLRRHFELMGKRSYTDKEEWFHDMAMGHVAYIFHREKVLASSKDTGEFEKKAVDYGRRVLHAPKEPDYPGMYREKFGFDIPKQQILDGIAREMHTVLNDKTFFNWEGQTPLLVKFYKEIDIFTGEKPLTYSDKRKFYMKNLARFIEQIHGNPAYNIDSMVKELETAPIALKVRNELYREFRRIEKILKGALEDVPRYLESGKDTSEIVKGMPNKLALAKLGIYIDVMNAFLEREVKRVSKEMREPEIEMVDIITKPEDPLDTRSRQFFSSEYWEKFDEAFEVLEGKRPPAETPIPEEPAPENIPPLPESDTEVVPTVHPEAAEEDLGERMFTKYKAAIVAALEAGDNQTAKKLAREYEEAYEQHESGDSTLAKKLLGEDI